MTTVQQFSINPMTVMGDAITSRLFGMNLADGYDQFGTLPWQRFDEVQSAIGSTLVRFPGGSEAETLFDYAHPQATSAIGSAGQIIQLTTPEAFLNYSASVGSRATIVLPTEQLLTAGAYGSRDFDASKADEVRAYVDYLLNKAGPAGIATFELGNEYATYMNAVEYGKVASTLALIVKQETDKYYAAHPTCTAARPDIAVQVWGVSSGESLSLTDLATRNKTVMAQFNSTELAAITAVTSHFYYDEGKFQGLPNAHTYSNLNTALSYSTSLMNAWSTLTNRPLDTIFSEWNVNFADSHTWGAKEIPVLLEMFSDLVAQGVDEMDIWSTMYNATALGTARGDLQAGGTLMQIMSHELIGMKVADVPVASTDYDIHGFTGNGKTYLYVSSMSDADMTLKMDLSNYLDRYNLGSVRLMAPNDALSDGVYKTFTGLHAYEEPDVPILVTQLGVGGLTEDGLLTELLGAHDTLIIELDAAPIRLGSAKSDKMIGTVDSDRIDAMAANDLVNGMGGNDTIFGGMGNDALYGGDGDDRLWGGTGKDILWGDAGNDMLEGGALSDQLHGGTGDDELAGGDGSDTLWGDAGADAFIFRSGETGTDVVADFKSSDGDYVIYEGAAAVTPANFQIEIRAVSGVGTSAKDLLIHLGAGGPVIAILQDAGNLTSLHLQDGATGAVYDLL